MGSKTAFEGLKTPIFGTKYNRYQADRVDPNSTTRQARQMFEKSIEIDPKFADAYAGLGLTYYEQWARQWSQDPQSLERPFELAKRAIALDDSRSTAYSLLSHVYLWKKQHEIAYNLNHIQNMDIPIKKSYPLNFNRTERQINNLTLTFWS